MWMLSFRKKQLHFVARLLVETYRDLRFLSLERSTLISAGDLMWGDKSCLENHNRK